MVRRPLVSSIRSRHTGQVGSSTRDAVGGGNGLVVKGCGAVSKEGSEDDDGREVAAGMGAIGLGWAAGVKGSFVFKGKLVGSVEASADV